MGGLRLWLWTTLLVVATSRSAVTAAQEPTTSASSEFSLSPAVAQKPAAADPEVSQFAQMDLESLMQVQITAGTLTRTQRHLVPAAITTIDRQDIDNANPRSLTELVDIYVPNLHWEY